MSDDEADKYAKTYVEHILSGQFSDAAVRATIRILVKEVAATTRNLAASAVSEALQKINKL